MPTTPRRSDNSTVGILLMIAAVTCFTGLDATAKWISQVLPPLQTVSVRYLSALFFVTALCRPTSNPGILRTSHPAIQSLRALSLVLATICSFTALHYLPLGQVTAIQFASPLVIAALAGPLLGEWPGPHRIAAILVGVLVVTRPTGPAHWAVLVAVATALMNAVYALTTRRLAGRDKPLTTLFWSASLGALIVAPIIPFVWVSPPGRIWLAMVLMGILATVGHYLMIQANERTPASVLAPFSYTQLVGATVLGWLVFGDAPDAWTLIGGLIVGASGLYMVLRERSPPTPL